MGGKAIDANTTKQNTREGINMWKGANVSSSGNSFPASLVPMYMYIVYRYIYLHYLYYIYIYMSTIDIPISRNFW